MHFESYISTSIWSYAVSWILLASLQQASASSASQLTSFNSTFTLSQQQIIGANFTASEAESINNIINWERSQYAGGPTSEDEFYNLPPLSNGSSLTPGALIKVEDFTNITNYSLSPNLALSRIIYMSRNLNGTSVPASAFILWPFRPRQFPSSNTSTAPVVIWTHMTSGFFGPASPGKHRTLFAGDNAPFALALAGYAVIAPDYAGLGVSHDFNEDLIQHQYLASPASANDAIFSFKAARKAFTDRLDKNFVVMGQSQGGGVAWGTAELLAEKPTLSEGYLGTISIGPTTEFLSGSPSFIAPFVGFGLSSVFPGFEFSDWMTPFGVERANVLQKVQGGLATAMALFTTDIAVALDAYEDSWQAKAYALLADAGNKRIAGPMLVIQGTEDAFIPFAVTTKTVNDTCVKYPDNQIEYLVSNGTGHVPTLDATRQIWLSWIEDRFLGKPVEKRECGYTTQLESFLPIERYQATGNSFVQWAGADEYSYEVPLAL